jgi:hypothetical protein
MKATRNESAKTFILEADSEDLETILNALEFAHAKWWFPKPAKRAITMYDKLREDLNVDFNSDGELVLQ